LIRKVYNNYQNCKILGTCFGVQIIAEAFSGKSARMEQCVRGSSKLEISDDFWELPYVKELNVRPKKKLAISKCHFDCVVEPPPCAKVYA
jgi:GMP synthase-like glutamine amidotransferase